MSLPAENIRRAPIVDSPMLIGPTLAHIASEYSQFLDMAGRAQGNLFLVHDLIGLHTIDHTSIVQTTVGVSPQTYLDNSMLTTDFEGAVSALSVDGNHDAVAAFTTGFGFFFVERRPPRQETDAIWDMAAINLFTQQQTRATTSLSGDTYPTYLATPSTWASVKTSLAGDYPAAAISAMNGYIAEGYSLLVPEHGALREPPITVTDAYATVTQTLIEGLPITAISPGPEMTRSAFLAWRPASGAIDRMALVIYDQRHGRVLKGGAGVAVDPSDMSIRPPDLPKTAKMKSARSDLSVDGKSGSVSYTPPPDLVDGSGDFPRSLSFQRSYDQMESLNYGAGTGWKTNWVQSVESSNDGMLAFGQGGAQAIGSALVAMQAIADLATTQDAQHLFALAQVSAWLSDQTLNNSAVVSRGLDAPVTFYKQADGTTYVSAGATGDKLVRSGSPAVSIINRWLYYPLTFTYFDHDYSKRIYPYPYTSDEIDRITNPYVTSALSNKRIYLSSWSFPSGINISTSYFNLTATPEVVGLYSATNNLGFSITSNPAPDIGSATRQPTCPNKNQPPVWLNARDATTHYTTSSGQTFVINSSAMAAYKPILPESEIICVNYTPTWDDGDTQKPVQQIASGVSTIKSVTDAANATWAYGRTLVASTNEIYYGGYTALAGVYKPSTTTPALTITFGQDANAQTVTDLNSHAWSYFNSGHRSEVLSPIQASASPAAGQATYYDRWGQPVMAVDPLQRVTLTSFDDLGRIIQTTLPEGNSQLKSYDARGNVVTDTQRAKPGSGLADLVTSVTYITGPTIATCSSPTCNQIDTVTSPASNRRKYTWDPTHGQLLTATSGLNGAGACAVTGGVCPLTAITYTSYTGTDGATLYLATSNSALTKSG